MSKAIKSYMMRDYSSFLEGVEDAVVVSVRGIEANVNNKMRLELRKKDIRVTVMRNNLLRRTIEETTLSGLSPVLEGPTALAYGAESVVEVAREIVKWAKEIEELELKGAILDGELYEGAAGVKKLSKFPTRDEAISETVTLFLSPGGKLVSQANGPGNAIAGAIKSLQEKLENGETIAKAG